MKPTKRPLDRIIEDLKDPGVSGELLEDTVTREGLANALEAIRDELDSIPRHIMGWNDHLLGDTSQPDRRDLEGL